MYLQELSLCHLSLQLLQIYFFSVMLILLHVHYSCHIQTGKDIYADSTIISQHYLLWWYTLACFHTSSGMEVVL